MAIIKIKINRTSICVILGLVIVISIIVSLWYRTITAKPVFITVSLGDAPSKTKGIPIAQDGQGSGSGNLLHSCIANIVVHDKLIATLPCAAASVLVVNGHVSDLIVRRPLQPIAFTQIKSDLLTTLNTLHIKPNHQMLSKMALWPANDRWDHSSVYPMTYQVGTTTSYPGLEVTIQVTGDMSGGWFYLLILHQWDSKTSYNQRAWEPEN